MLFRSQQLSLPPRGGVLHLRRFRQRGHFLQRRIPRLHRRTEGSVGKGQDLRRNRRCGGQGTVCACLRGPGSSGGWLAIRSEEHTSELQSLMRISYAVFCLKKTTIINSMMRYDQLSRQTKTRLPTQQQEIRNKTTVN